MTCCSKPPPSHHRSRPKAPRRAHWAHRRAAQLGIGTDPPSARPYHRTGRRLVAQPSALDCLPAPLLSLGRGALTPVPPSVPGTAHRRVPGWATGVLRWEQARCAVSRRCPCARTGARVRGKLPFPARATTRLSALRPYSDRFSRPGHDVLGFDRLLLLWGRDAAAELDGAARRRSASILARADEVIE